MEPRHIGELVRVTRLVPPETACLEVDRIFAQQLELTSVVVVADDGVRIVDRVWFATMFAGRLGFGRALHAQRPIGEVVVGGALTLEHDTPVVVASERLLARRGRERYLDVIVTREGAVVGTVTVSAVLEELSRVFGHRAHHDPLTGLPNRALLIDRLHTTLEASDTHRPVGAVALLFLDLDGFKAVNDGLGHHAGDQLLVAVARRLTAVLRAEDTVARLGGDEFAVLVDAARPDDVTDLADRLVRELRAPFELSHGPVTIHASIGVAIAHPGDTAEVLLRRADAAMYRAKHGSGDRWYLGDHVDGTTAWLDDAARLRRAIDRDELALRYQPVVDLAEGRLRRVEALVRWPQPDGTERPPLTFIPLAERCGAIHELGQWVLQRALEQLAAWDAMLGPASPPAVSVNLSAVQLEDPQLPARIDDALHAAGIAPERLCLEVTETALIRDLAGSIELLTALRELGIHLAIDDFGVGSSSLGNLARLPVTELKMDRSFTSELAGTGAARRVVELVVALGHALTLEVVAEGIEGLEQAELVRALGCDLGQGYHYARPLTAGQLTATLVDSAATSAAVTA